VALDSALDLLGALASEVRAANMVSHLGELSPIAGVAVLMSSADVMRIDAGVSSYVCAIVLFALFGYWGKRGSVPCVL
jgi:hypothetical protein